MYPKIVKFLDGTTKLQTGVTKDGRAIWDDNGRHYVVVYDGGGRRFEFSA